jgi:hypothetical protein
MMRALRAHTPAWNIRINLVAPSVTFTNLLPSETRKHYERLGVAILVLLKPFVHQKKTRIRAGLVFDLRFRYSLLLIDLRV